MRNFLVFVFVFVFVPIYSQYNIIPQPVSVDYIAEQFQCPATWTIVASDKAQKHVAQLVVEQMKERGMAAKVSAKGCVVLKHDATLGEEAYALTVTKQGITVKASTEKGYFYALQSLLQMIAQADATMQGVRISDKPRFEYRGLMLDVVRCYMPKAEILRIIDIASQLKINNLHLHLTDDNGWRMEIKKYPRLTEVGAWRVERNTHFQNRENPRADEPTPVGGVYTQKELREIVAYAARRGMNVIPEIEMPAHSVAAIASYPEMTCPVMGDRFIGVLPGIGGKDASIIYCAGNEKVYSFLQDILDEVLKVFPSEYIHIGGDEAEKSHWQACELCQTKMRNEGIADEEHLQGYFMDRMIRYLQSKGRKAIGWDEVTMGHPKEDITIFGWRGQGQAAVKDARENGRRFVMTPAAKLYLIRYQGPQWFEPYTYFGNNTLHDVYSYEAVAKDWTPELESQLWGIQSSLWTEFCLNTDDVEYLLFPRVMALADNAWREKGKSDWTSFVKGLDSYLQNLDREHVTYARSSFNLSHKVLPNGENVEVTLSCERPDVEIRYSLDGTEPTAKSALYANKVPVVAGSTLKASTFKGGEKMGKTLVLPVIKSVAAGAKVKAVNCTNGLADMLTNGIRGTERHSDFEWAGWYNTDAEFVVDLGGVKNITRVDLGTLSNCNMTVAAPRAVYLYASNDGATFTMLGTQMLGDDAVYSKLPNKVNVGFTDLNTNARYLKIHAVHPGTIPADYLRGGQAPWIYFDEIVVE